MDNEKLKQDLLEEAKTLTEDINFYCIGCQCTQCDFHLENDHCLINRLFIALCNGYALGADKQSVSHDIDKMLKELFPHFYKHITKRELEP